MIRETLRLVRENILKEIEHQRGSVKSYKEQGHDKVDPVAFARLEGYLDGLLRAEGIVLNVAGQLLNTQKGG